MYKTLKRLAALLGLILLSVWGIVVGHSEANTVPAAKMAFVQDELLIGISPGAAVNLNLMSHHGRTSTGLASLDSINHTFRAESVQKVFANLDPADEDVITYGLNGVIKVSFPSGTDIFAALEAYRTDPNVSYVEVNRIYVAFETPNDPGFRKQWALHNTGQTGGRADADIDAPEAWDITQGNDNVLVAVIDTGVDASHVDLNDGRVRTDIGYDFVNDDDDATDDHGHGTYVSGIIAAISNNEEGIAGICRNCQILPVKVLDSEGSGTTESVAQGIQYAADKGADIINMSLGFPSDCGCSRTVANVINYAYDKGALLIAAAGNDGDKARTSYPASSPRVIAVGASDHNDEEADFSNHGSDLTIIAPGVDIYSLDIDRSSPYRMADGTSAAAPHVAGVAGLVLSKENGLSNAELWFRLYQSADNFPASARRLSASSSLIPALSGQVFTSYLPQVSALRQSFGRLNAYNAVTLDVGGVMFSPPDLCDGEPDCQPGCGIEVALASNVSPDDDLRTLRDFRDKALATAPGGLELIAQYNEHRLEVAYLLAMDTALRADARALLADWLPLLRAIVDPDARQDVFLTTGLLDSSIAFIDRLNAVAGPALRDDLLTTRQLLIDAMVDNNQEAAVAWDAWVNR